MKKRKSKSARSKLFAMQQQNKSLDYRLVNEARRTDEYSIKVTGLERKLRDIQYSHGARWRDQEVKALEAASHAVESIARMCMNFRNNL